MDQKQIVIKNHTHNNNNNKIKQFLGFLYIYTHIHTQSDYCDFALSKQDQRHKSSNCRPNSSHVVAPHRRLRHQLHKFVVSFFRGRLKDRSRSSGSSTPVLNIFQVEYQFVVSFFRGRLRDRSRSSGSTTTVPNTFQVGYQFVVSFFRGRLRDRSRNSGSSTPVPNRSKVGCSIALLLVSRAPPPRGVLASGPGHRT